MSDSWLEDLWLEDLWLEDLWLEDLWLEDLWLEDLWLEDSATNIRQPPMLCVSEPMDFGWIRSLSQTICGASAGGSFADCGSAIPSALQNINFLCSAPLTSEVVKHAVDEFGRLPRYEDRSNKADAQRLLSELTYEADSPNLPN